MSKVKAEYLNIAQLKPFEGHPFQVREDEEMDQLMWSILSQGLLTPLVVRPLENDQYEVISGHRRLLACQKAGIEAVEVAMRADTYPTADFKGNAKLAEKYGIELWSLHLPIAPQEHYDVSNKFATVEAMAYQTELIKRACETMGIKHFVIHSGGEPIREEDREDRVKLAGEKLSVLADLTAQYGADMCI